MKISLLTTLTFNALLQNGIPEFVIVRDDKIVKRKIKVTAALSALSWVIIEIVIHKDVLERKSTWLLYVENQYDLNHGDQFLLGIW